MVECIRYVAGFLYSTNRSKVVLIKKARPEEQAGKLNGVGGKVENGESPDIAMQREFQEETGKVVNNWNLFLRMTDYLSYEVSFFRSFSDELNVKTMDATEPVWVVPIVELNDFTLFPNLAWIIPISLDETLRMAVVMIKPEE
jgi:8-oxo-dGTP diphosphatase